MSNHKNKQQTNICFVGLNPERFYGQFPWHPSARLLFAFSLCMLSLSSRFELDFKCPTRGFDYTQIYGHETVVFSIIIYLFVILVIGVLLSCYCCRRCRPRSTQSPIERAAGGEMHSVAAVRNQNVNNGLSTRREDTEQIN